MINATTSGDNLIISSNSTPIIILGLFLVTDTQMYVRYKNGTNNPVSGPIFLFQGGSHNLNQQDVPYFVCGAGSGTSGGFYINLSTSGIVGGTLYYTLGGA